MVVLTYTEPIFNFPRSSLPSNRFMIASIFSAMCSVFISSCPTVAWMVFDVLDRTFTVFRRFFATPEISIVGGTGFGIFPRGPRMIPSVLPMVGISGASAMKIGADSSDTMKIKEKEKLKFSVLDLKKERF